ncbi:MAG: J domain-containing protein [Polyangiaceae bacterium]
MKPDASHGGARSREEALAEAEKAAGCRLTPIDPIWARAWARVLTGQPPFSDGRAPRPSAPRAAKQPSAYEVLGVSAQATPEEVKRAYRQRALETHPDRGGTAEAFRRVHSAFESIQKRRTSQKPKRKRA